MTEATTTMTTMSSAASIVEMAFLFPSIFLNFFTPLCFLRGLAMPSPDGVQAKAWREGSVDLLTATVAWYRGFLVALFMHGLSLQTSFLCPGGRARKPQTLSSFDR